jgi:queuine tRNA-ribosyltransferase
LFISGEILASMIATVHNLGFYLWMMREAREKILAGEFMNWKTRMAVQFMQRL